MMSNKTSVQKTKQIVKTGNVRKEFVENNQIIYIYIILYVKMRLDYIIRILL